MTDKANIIIEQARALSRQERIEIAEALMASVVDEPDAEIEKAWDAEIEARVAALDRGEVELHDADAVFAELRLRLAKP